MPQIVDAAGALAAQLKLKSSDKIVVDCGLATERALVGVVAALMVNAQIVLPWRVRDAAKTKESIALEKATVVVNESTTGMRLEL